MIIKNDDIPYSYTCLFPCGEDAVVIEIQNDLRTQDANFGLSVSAKGLQFIKDDAAEVRNLIDSEYDYYVEIGGTKFFLDFENYEDDGLFLEVPLISSGIKQVLQNMTIESLGITKTDVINIKKKPQMLFSVAVSGISGTRNILALARFADFDKDVISGVLPSNVSLPDETWFLKKEIPVANARTTAPNLTIKVEGNLSLNNPNYTGQTKSVNYRLRRRLIGRKEDGTEVLIDEMYATTIHTDNSFVIGNTESVWFSTSNIVNYRYCEDYYNGDEIVSAYVQYGLQVECNTMGGLSNTYWSLDLKVTISGEMFVIDYDLPAISMSTIQTALTAKGIGVSLIAGNYYLASGNIDKLNSTKIIELITFFARFKGLIISFTNDSCNGLDLMYYVNNPVNIGNNYCKWQKKGISQYYAQKVGNNPSKVRLKNTPESMWSNTYQVPQTSNLFKMDNLQGAIIYDGAEIVNQLISDSKEVFILDARNSELVSDDELPINYSFAAVCMAYNNRERIFSNAPSSAKTFTPADTSGVTFTIPNHIAGLTTASSINYSNENRLSPYVIEMDVPMTQTLITQILTAGRLVCVEVNSIVYYVESCTLKLTPSQCHLVLREVIKTPA